LSKPLLPHVFKIPDKTTAHAYSKNGNKEAQQLILVFVHSLTDI